MSLDRDLERALIALRTVKPAKRKRPGDGKSRAWRIAHLCYYCEAPVRKGSLGLCMEDEETGVEYVAHRRCIRESER
jgi:hypothetical protein